MFIPHLANFLSAGLKLYLPVPDFHLFRDDLEREMFIAVKSKHPWREAKILDCVPPL